ncbi:MAG: hypothetical protein RBG13Loki_2568 [Promethearchaeota archaeon CR_4]|nr:MAG: hypothetical protein RBG13Loki_2568 [Candidatus Lokiarchaeota archaeon CR_4]
MLLAKSSRSGAVRRQFEAGERYARHLPLYGASPNLNLLGNRQQHLVESKLLTLEKIKHHPLQKVVKLSLEVGYFLFRYEKQTLRQVRGKKIFSFC